MKKLFFASVALLAVFSSCQREDIRTVYETNPAVATVTVTVWDSYLGKDVTQDAGTKITASASSMASDKVVISGNKVTLTGSKSLAQTSLKIDAEFNGHKGSATVVVAALVEGAVADYAAKVVLEDGKTSTSYAYETRNGDVSVKWAGCLDYAHTVHADARWCVNNSMYVLFGKTNYTSETGLFGTPVMKYDGLNDAEKLYVDEKMAQIPSAYATEKKDYEYTVAAFSYYNVYVTINKTVKYVDFYRIHQLADGTVEREKMTTCSYEDLNTVVEYKEIASPDHTSHYVPGHGVDDPTYSHEKGHGGLNAGGGIVVAD